MLLPHLEGWGRFTREVASRLVRQHPEGQFDLLFDRRPLPQYHFGPNQTSHILPPQTRHWTLYEVWWRLSVPWYLQRHRPQALFATYGLASRSVLRRVPVVAFIHDLAFLRHPEFLPRDLYGYYLYTVKHVAKHATLLVVNSESVRHDLLELLGVAPERVRLAYSGCDTEFFKPLPPDQQEAVRQRYTGGLPYLLYVGSLHPRKNPLRMLRAYALLRKAYQEPLRLLCVGRFMWRKNEVMRLHRQLPCQDEVLFHPPIPDAELVQVYGAAAAVVYPSLYEGFGSPVAEGLACGVPVVTSRVSSLPEVGGEAAFYADPYDEADIARALHEALTLTPEARARRAALGRAHVHRFSWEVCVQTIWDSLLAVI